MNYKWIVAVCSIVCSSGAAQRASVNRIGLERPTDQPVQIDDNDLSSLINNVFGPDATTPGAASAVVTTAPYPSVDENQDPRGETGVVTGTGMETGDDDCVCVPYYQCDTNRTIIEDGTGLIDIRLKDGPCEDYINVCCKKEDTLPQETPVTRAPPPVPASDTCGQRNLQGVSSLRITGTTENEAQFGEFPWVVAIIKKDPVSGVNVYQCAGSLIESRVVLTAAHCVSGKADLMVRAGEWDTQRSNEPLPSQNRPVREVLCHEQFNPGSLHNDVALLILEAPVDLAPNVAPICLPQQGENMDGRACVAGGWGKDVFGKEGKYQVILKKVEVPMVRTDMCQQALRKTRLGQNFKLHSSFICAGGVPGKDTCKGDGGGPLMCPTTNNPSIYVQAGIVAWGIGCGTETPGVYVNVPMFRNWIDNKLSIHNIDPRVD